ncbi:MAG: mechanosensitive ion channel domain-containing protein [Halobacteriaceae archaeon]
MTNWEVLLQPENVRLLVATGVLLLGLLIGYLIGRGIERILVRLEIPEQVEGTSFERTAQSLGTSTVSIFAHFISWIIYIITLLYALRVAQLLETQMLILGAANILPNVIIALIILAAGFIIGDKVQLLVSEYLRGIKLPEAKIVPQVARYSVIYVAILLAANQLGVANTALLILLAAYAIAIIIFTAIAVKDLLAASAAGIYLLLREPYSIGDKVEIGEHQGIVQEINMFITRIESDDHEYIVPNHLVIQNGVILVRD